MTLEKLIKKFFGAALDFGSNNFEIVLDINVIQFKNPVL